MDKASCEKCGRMAVWEYMPSDGDGIFCDDCVPRGCSCNVIDWEDPSPNPEQHRDDLGRLIPCCEYWFFEDGVDLPNQEPTP